MKKLSSLKLLVSLTAGIGLLFLIIYQSGMLRTGTVQPGTVESHQKKGSGTAFKAMKKTVPLVYKAVGTVHSREEVELSPRIIARIEKVNARSGDKVKKGELLVKLDDGDLKAAMERTKEQIKEAEATVSAAEQSIKQARAAFLLAESNLKRDRILIKKRVIARKTLDEAVSMYDQAQSVLNQATQKKNRGEASLVAARESLKEAKAKLSYAYIRSPMDGIVAEQFADPGDLASPGNILMTIFNPDRLMMYVPIRESLVPQIKIGDNLTFTVEALKKDLKGVIREIVASVDPGSRTFLIKVCLEQVGGLMPGMFGTVKINIGTEKVILIPVDAIRHVGQLEYVSVRIDDGIREVLIRSVPYSSELVKVVSGLHDGEILDVVQKPDETHKP